MSDVILSSLKEVKLDAGNYMVDFYLMRDRQGVDLFDLNAPYQRGSVWTVEQRRNLIKSLLMGLPVGNIIFSELPYTEGGASYRVVDGKQRIEALRAFFADEFSIPVEWTDSRWLKDPTDREVPGGHVLASELNDQGRRTIEGCMLGGSKFDARYEVTENLNFDESLSDQWHNPLPGNEGNPNLKRWFHRQRSNEEILKAEAELYLLVNFGGVAQIDEDRQRADSLAGRERS